LAALMKFTQGFAIPCLLFRAISTLDLGQSFDLTVLGIFYFGALVALEANYAIIAIHSPFCYGVGITAMEIARNRGGSIAKLPGKVLRAMFHNALIIGITLGFIVNLTGLPLPGAFSDALDLIIRAALPAALFGLGGVLYRYRPEGDMRTILYVVVISLLLHPVVVWTLGNAVSLSTDALRSAMLTASMAPGVNAYVFANMYGKARRVAASAVLISTGLSIFTVWCWLYILP